MTKQQRPAKLATKAVRPALVQIKVSAKLAWDQMDTIFNLSTPQLYQWLVLACSVQKHAKVVQEQVNLIAPSASYTTT